MQHAENPAQEEVHGGHETRDVNFRPIVIAAVLSVPILVGVFAAMGLTLHLFGSYEASISPRVNPLSAQYGRQVPPEPRLQTHPVQDLKDLRARDEVVLDSYAWVDQRNGRVRLPIARAMELTLQRGLPVRSAAAKDGQP